MARRLRLKSIKGRVKSTSIQRTGRLKSLKLETNINREQLTDLIETDEFENLEISKEEQEELETDGWTYVASSNVKAVRLEIKGKSPALQVMFGDGSVYEWLTNAEILFTSLTSSISKGRAIRTLGLYGTHARKIR